MILWFCRTVNLFFFQKLAEKTLCGSISGIRRTTWETVMSLGQWSMNCLMRTWGFSLDSSKSHMAYSSCSRWLLITRGPRGSGPSQLQRRFMASICLNVQKICIIKLYASVPPSRRSRMSDWTIFPFFLSGGLQRMSCLKIGIDCHGNAFRGVFKSHGG